MKLREYLASDEFQNKSLEEKQSWLSSKVPGYEALPSPEKRRLYSGFGARPESIKTKVQLADQAVTNFPLGKTIQDVGMQTLGALGGGAAGTLAAPFTGPAAPAVPFAGARLGEGAMQGLSDFMHGSSGKEAAKDLYKTPMLNTALMGALKGAGGAVKKIFPGYAKAVMKIEPPLTKEMMDAKGVLPKATQEESTAGYTTALKKATGHSFDPGRERAELADNFVSGKKTQVSDDVKATREMIRVLKKQLPKDIWSQDARGEIMRDSFRKKGVPIPSEEAIRESNSPTRLPTKVPISPTGGTAQQEGEINYHIDRLASDAPEKVGDMGDNAKVKSHISELYRLRRWIADLRNFGGEEIKDARSLSKGVKNRLNDAYAEVQKMIGEYDEGKIIHQADRQLIKEKAGRAYNSMMPEGRGSMYHLGAAFSPFLLYHLGVPFLPASMIASVMSSPKAASTAFKLAPKLAPTAARTAGVGLKDLASSMGDSGQ